MLIPTYNGNKTVEELCGWAGKYPELRPEIFDLLSRWPQIQIFGDTPDRVYTGQRIMLFEVWRAASLQDPPNYPQEVGDPFIAGTKILMADGSEKNIEDMEVGDVVLNHKNQPAKVTNLIRKQFTGDLVTVKVKGWHRTITATETHTGLYMPKPLARFKFNGFNKKKFGEYQVGDYVQIPFGLEANECHILDIKDYVKDCEYDEKYVWRNRSKKVNRFVPVDINFARFIGLYLAEGGVGNPGSIQFSFNSDEVVLHQEIQTYLKDIFGLDSKVRQVKPTCSVVCASSIVVSEFIKKLIPGDLYHKSVPTLFYSCGMLTKLSLLRGWMDGDGYISKKYNRLIGVSSSHRLINDISRLALSCHINPRTLIRKKSSHQRVAAGQVDIYGGDCATVYDEWKQKKELRKLRLDRTPYGFARRITSIQRTPVHNETVYCITTEGEYTLTANGVNFSNCVSFGMKNAVEHAQLIDIAHGDRNEFKLIFPPYVYGISRVQVGGGHMWADGSVGGWAAEGVVKYGVISSDTEGCPKYSGSIARKWGKSPGPPEQFITIGKQHLVASAARVTSWNDALKSLINGYPLTICSEYGFDMKARQDGFMHNSTTWAHQMEIMGIDDGDDKVEPHVAMLNSWGCFSNDTEILTEFGWTLFSELPKYLRVATLNQTTGKLEYQKPTEYFEYDYSGPLYNFIGRDIDQLVTPNHRIYHRKQNHTNWEFDTADHIIKNFEMKKDCEWDGQEEEFYEFGNYKIPMDIWLEFLGYFISEGYTSISKRVAVSTYAGNTYNNGYGYRVGICQQKASNLDKIEKCISQLPFKSHRTKVGWIFTKKALYTELKQFGKAADKFIPDYVKKLSRRQQTILFDALMVGDGCYSKGLTGDKVTYYTSSKKLADDMQELLLKIGYAGDISSTNRIGRENKKGITRSIEYRIGIKRHELTPCKPGGGWIPILIPYNDKVYCVSVPNQVVFVRRNGKACWSGNSVFGEIKDFRTGSIWPAGSLRIRKKDFEGMIHSGECFAISFQGFKGRDLQRSDFTV